MISTINRAGRALLALVAVALMLTGCGDSGSLIADGGIRGTGKSVGPVAGFGSVIVNGTRFTTDAAQFVVNGDEFAIQAELSEGMLVIVDINDDDENQADRVTYNDDVRGPLAGDFDSLSGEMTVLGQTIGFNSATVFRGLTLNELDIVLESDADAAYVQVSGWYLDSGEFLASFVRSRRGFSPSVDDVRIRATLDNISTLNETFRMGGLTVDYGQNPEIEMANGRDQLRGTDRGAFIEVEGFLTEIGGSLIARDIEEENRDDRLGDVEGDDIRIEGVITRPLDKTPSGTLEINGITVRVNPGTELEGLTATALQSGGTRIFIQGVGDTGATVVAKRVETREPDVVVAGHIEDIAGSANPREGRLTVDGVRVEVTLRTIVVASGQEGSGTLRFEDLRPDDFVEVTGILTTEDEREAIEAVKVERNLVEDEDGDNDDDEDEEDEEDEDDDD